MMYKNLVVNAFGDTVERTDYGTHKNQLNLFDNLNDNGQPQKPPPPTTRIFLLFIFYTD